MSDGHRHRYMPAPKWLYRAMHVLTIRRTSDRQRAELSRYVWTDDARGGYRLTLLGLLHGLTGLTLKVKS